MLPFNSKDLKEFVFKWNQRLPLDKWYRDFHKIPFNSKQHREISLIDIYIEYIDHYYFDYRDKKINFLKEKKKKDKNFVEEKPQTEYIKGTGNFMKDIVWNQNDIDKAFEELDLDKY